jgi:hypothetical protein
MSGSATLTESVFTLKKSLIDEKNPIFWLPFCTLDIAILVIFLKVANQGNKTCFLAYSLLLGYTLA